MVVRAAFHTGDYNGGRIIGNRNDFNKSVLKTSIVLSNGTKVYRTTNIMDV